jgi:hypothetical protein
MLVALLAAAAVAHPPAHAVLQSCAKSTDVTQRAAVFEGSMRAWRHSTRLQMRFRLQARTPDDRVWRGIDASGFGPWQNAASGVRHYVYDKRVEGLLAPASYRAVVRFRWRDARGHVVGRARRFTRSCHQPDPRPNLVLQQLVVNHVGPGTARYAAVVANTGRTAVDDFSVRFLVAGATVGEAPAGPLAPGDTTRVTLDGGACTPGQTLAAIADPAAVVDERNETDNELDSTCTYGAPGTRRSHLH